MWMDMSEKTNVLKKKHLGENVDHGAIVSIVFVHPKYFKQVSMFVNMFVFSCQFIPIKFQFPTRTCKCRTIDNNNSMLGACPQKWRQLDFAHHTQLIRLVWNAAKRSHGNQPGTIDRTRCGNTRNASLTANASFAKLRISNKRRICERKIRLCVGGAQSASDRVLANCQRIVRTTSGFTSRVGGWNGASQGFTALEVDAAFSRSSSESSMLSNFE